MNILNLCGTLRSLVWRGRFIDQRLNNSFISARRQDMAQEIVRR